MRRTRHVLAARYERHHYTTTAHTDTVALRSNSGEYVPGSPTGDGTNTTLRRDMPDAPNKRAAYPKLNTMANRRNGGPSLYYKAREGYGQ